MTTYIFLVISVFYIFENNAYREIESPTLNTLNSISIRNLDTSPEDTIEISPRPFDLCNVEVFNFIIENNIKPNNNQATLWTGRNSWLHKAFEIAISPLKDYGSSGGIIYLFYKNISGNKNWYISLQKESELSKHHLPNTENLNASKKKLIKLDNSWCKGIKLNTHGETPLHYAFRRNNLLFKKTIFTTIINNINDSTDTISKKKSISPLFSDLFRDQLKRYYMAKDKRHALTEIDKTIPEVLKKFERYAYPVIDRKHNSWNEENKQTIPCHYYITDVGLLEEIRDLKPYIEKKLKRKNIIAFLIGCKKNKISLPKLIINIILSQAYPSFKLSQAKLYNDFFNLIDDVIKHSQRENLTNNTSGLFHIDESCLLSDDSDMISNEKCKNARHDEKVYINSNQLDKLKYLANEIRKDAIFKDIHNPQKVLYSYKNNEGENKNATLKDYIDELNDLHKVEPNFLNEQSIVTLRESHANKLLKKEKNK